MTIVNRSTYLYIAMVLLLIFWTTYGFSSDPIGIPDPYDIEYPNDEEHSDYEIYLGKVLFFDNRLSFNNKQSCATCHNPDLGFGDGLKKGRGAKGDVLERNTPHLYNLAWNSTFFWDGRSTTLEEQALIPISSPKEMNMPIDVLTPKLLNVPYYQKMFRMVYGDEGITKNTIARALAAFERSIVVDDTPFDRYMKGDKIAMSSAQIRGMQLFQNKARCTECHDGPNFTNEAFHNIGVGGDDAGRMKIDKSANFGAFKTPGLRNVLLTAPYMHDGSIGTLEEVIDFYDKGGTHKENLDKLMKPLDLTDNEKADLIAFLGALTSPLEIKRPPVVTP